MPTCEIDGQTVHIYSPPSSTRRRLLRCPVDERITECVVTVSAWHDAVATCTRCGESWSGEGLFPRPFARGWRKKAQAEARADWDAATYGPFPSLEEMGQS